jgi:hypothetical protein
VRVIKFSKLIVILVIALNIVFTIAVLFIFYKTGSEPMTLVGTWFAFTTGELWMLSSIKKTKVHEGKQSLYSNKIDNRGEDIDENYL